MDSLRVLDLTRPFYSTALSLKHSLPRVFTNISVRWVSPTLLAITSQSPFEIYLPNSGILSGDSFNTWPYSELLLNTSSCLGSPVNAHCTTRKCVSNRVGDLQRYFPWISEKHVKLNIFKIGLWSPILCTPSRWSFSIKPHKKISAIHPIMQAGSLEVIFDMSFFLISICKPCHFFLPNASSMKNFL